jgi:mono/diheme cytochrome c family protein
MRKTFFLIGITFSLLFILFSTGCVNNKKDILFGCDSTNVSYSKTIKPILQNNCYRCHSAANAPSLGGGNGLDNYISLINWVDTTAGSDGGILLNDVKHIGNSMPKPPAAKLGTCDIAKIAHWISEGAKEN